MKFWQDYKMFLFFLSLIDIGLHWFTFLFLSMHGETRNDIGTFDTAGEYHSSWNTNTFFFFSRFYLLIYSLHFYFIFFFFLPRKQEGNLILANTCPDFSPSDVHCCFPSLNFLILFRLFFSFFYEFSSYVIFVLILFLYLFNMYVYTVIYFLNFFSFLIFFYILVFLFVFLVFGLSRYFFFHLMCKNSVSAFFF